jgi:predicted amidohydrolase
MQTVRVALAQIAPKLGDLTHNLELHLDVIRRARREKASVVVFPELSLTGYLLRDQVQDVAIAPASKPYRQLLRASREIDVVFGAENLGAHVQ